ncbi:LSM domain containing protein protein, putative [Babesia ovis]|uniref:LSM domain containing protein protein, putative n=1 Tax=Babesia ovis TaxID=5869 RepID=A0A9W5T9U5_BABOV|nr:LSM domain containing protein protein, putative [Babesia ovis]
MDGGRIRDHDERVDKQQWIWVVEDELGSLIWVTLRDETYYVGIFKSFDQYGNIVLTDTVRKVVINSKRSFSDVYCGNIIIRGESIAYFCALDAEAYLNTFNYEGTFDRAHLAHIARKREVAVASRTVSSPLKYIPLDDALRLLKEEQEHMPLNSRVFNDMMGNDAFA